MQSQYRIGGDHVARWTVQQGARVLALTFALVLSGGSGRGAQALRCEKQLSSCSCVTNYEFGGQVVDFSKLNSGSIVVPRIWGRMSEAPYWTIEYNPCGPFYCTDRVAAARFSFLYIIHTTR